MDLILVRHAKAENPLPELTDEERALTTEGRKQAIAAAKGLSLLLRKADKKIQIWSSNAKRSEQTAAIIGKALHNIKPQQQPAIYTGRLDELSNIWRQSDATTIIIVGHEPYLSICAKQLAEVRLPFKKCAAACFTLQQSDQAVLKWFAAPKILARLGAK